MFFFHFLLSIKFRSHPGWGNTAFGNTGLTNIGNTGTSNIGNTGTSTIGNLETSNTGNTGTYNIGNTGTCNNRNMGGNIKDDMRVETRRPPGPARRLSDPLGV